MARSSFTIDYDCGFPQAQQKVEAILIRHRFQPKKLKTGESVWKNGTGMASAMKFIKVEYSPKTIQLSAWIQMGIGSFGGGEMGLNGVLGAFPKKQLLSVIEEILHAF